MQKFFLWLQTFFAANKATFIRLFQIVYVLLALTVTLFAYSFSVKNEIFLFILNLGNKFGELALLMLIAVLLPGIFGRFRFRHPLITIGIMFRRYMGILAFMFGFTHASIEFFVPTILTGGSLIPSDFFEIFGLITLLLLFPLFLTSNDFSVKRLGKNWKTLHKLVYVIIWVIMLHVAFQLKGTWTLLALLTASAEITSLFYDWRLKSTVKQGSEVSKI
ncbi:MAG TPA: ferric reductase-like transmembrane domain-containing protein [Patescibacteria group bacterium]|nr:ferric reductase-like transmembrane domain-containing protein [Patescibacteria group bacterium]